MRLDSETLDRMRAIAGDAANYLILFFGNQREQPGTTVYRPAICCTLCGFVSFNENDIEQKYCGNCHQFFAFLPPWKEAVHD